VEEEDAGGVEGMRAAEHMNPAFDAELEKIIQDCMPDLMRAPYEAYVALSGQRIVLEELRKLAEEMGGAVTARTIDLMLQAVRRALTAVASRMMEEAEAEG
jgi:hypothetical protein